MEDKIRSLCARIIATKDDDLRSITVELRGALHQHIEELRARFADYPIVIERRDQNRVPPLDTPSQQNATKKSRSVSTVIITNPKTRTALTKPDSKPHVAELRIGSCVQHSEGAMEPSPADTHVRQNDKQGRITSLP